MKSRLKSNFIYHSLYQILAIISPLITSPYISRILGAEGLGTYSFYYSIAYYFGIFAVLGIANYGNRCIAKAQFKGIGYQSKIFWEILSMQAMTSLLVVVCYFIYVLFIEKQNKGNAFIEFFYILSVSMDISWFYFGIEEFKTTTFRSFITKIIIIASIFLFVKGPDDLNIYTFIMAGGTLLGSLTLWIPIKKYIKPIDIHLDEVKKHFMPNLILFIPVISLALFHYMDKIMLGSISTMEELGYYTNADKLINIPMGLIFGLGTVMSPRIAALSEEGKWGIINNYINKSIIFSMWMGTAICFGIISVSKEFVPLFFGEGYERCIVLLDIFSYVIIIKALSNVFRMQYLIPAGKDKEFNVSVIVAAVVNILFNLLFIPKYGAIGAVLGTLIAESIVLILYVYYSLKKIVITKCILPLIWFIISGIAMRFAVEYLKYVIIVENLFIKFIAEFLVGAIVYSILTGTIILVIDNDFKRNIMSTLKRKK